MFGYQTRYLLSLILLLPIFMFPTEKVPSSTKTTLTVKITDIRHDSGHLILCLSNEPDEFLTACIQEGKINVNGEKQLSMSFDNLDAGTYAISLFHDTNENGSLDTNFMGIPSEDFGFSNNPSLLFGAPKFKSCAIEVSDVGREIVIKMKKGF